MEPAGSRYESYDLRIGSSFGHLIVAGDYEVKKLYRRNERCSFDRRFKVGARGERMYGRRDAEIKSLALDIENHMDDGSFTLTAKGPYVSVDEMHGLIDEALHRRHSKSFIDRFTVAAEAYEDAMALDSARRFLEGSVQGPEIAQAFCDLQGIFIVAQDSYTLVKRDEIPRFLEFDAVSVEGVKLRYIGSIPE